MLCYNGHGYAVLSGPAQLSPAQAGWGQESCRGLLPLFLPALVVLPRGAAWSAALTGLPQARGTS